MEGSTIRGIGKEGHHRSACKCRGAVTSGKYAALWNERGFTLLEALFFFFIVFRISFSIPLVIKGFSLVREEMIPPPYYQWTLFNESVRQETWKSRGMTVTNSGFSFILNGEKVTYEKYQDSIRRRVNDKGHEVVLQKLSGLSFNAIDGGVRIEGVFLDGKKLEGEFFYYGE